MAVITDHIYNKMAATDQTETKMTAFFALKYRLLAFGFRHTLATALN